MGGRAVGAIGLCLLAAGSGRAADPGRFEFESPHMGTTFRVVLYAPDRPAAEAAAGAAFARVGELDRVMSDYIGASELMLLCKQNDAAPGVPVAVSPDLFDVLRKAGDTARRSDGAFDPTVGPLVRLWRLARRTQQLPDHKEIADARSKVGLNKLILDPTARTVAFKVAGMRLDLGGIGKGFAADAAVALLRDKHRLTRVLVAASGDITCGDPPPGADGWDVEISPLSKGKPPRRLRLANASVSTSGDLEQFVEIGGVRYSHVLDPRTGLGLTGRRSVTVVARTGWQADSLTKAASVLPPDKALPLIDATEGAATYIVVKDGDDAPERVTASKRFATYAARELPKQ